MSIKSLIFARVALIVRKVYLSGVDMHAKSSREKASIKAIGRKELTLPFRVLRGIPGGSSDSEGRARYLLICRLATSLCLVVGLFNPAVADDQFRSVRVFFPEASEPLPAPIEMGLTKGREIYAAQNHATPLPIELLVQRGILLELPLAAMSIEKIEDYQLRIRGPMDLRPVVFALRSSDGQRIPISLSPIARDQVKEGTSQFWRLSITKSEDLPAPDACSAGGTISQLRLVASQRPIGNLNIHVFCRKNLILQTQATPVQWEVYDGRVQLVLELDKKHWVAEDRDTKNLSIELSPAAAWQSPYLEVRSSRKMIHESRVFEIEGFIRLRGAGQARTNQDRLIFQDFEPDGFVRAAEDEE